MAHWLIVGSGGREYVMAQKLAEDSQTQVYVAPGNPMMAQLDRVEVVPIAAMAFDALVEFAIDHQVVCTVVGPEKPLAGGIVDVFQNAGQRIFGPTKAAAQLESSKAFAKNVMAKAGVATAGYREFKSALDVKSYFNQSNYPQVLKANGLASGKGVVVVNSKDEAYAAVDHLAHQGEDLDLLVEEYLQGEEFSAFAMVHGKQVEMMPLAQDHKRVGNGDTGPNTGGMGAYSPLPQFPDSLTEQVKNTIMIPVLEELERRGTPFSGLLYAGLINTADGVKVIEFNVRLGDPETQVVLPQLKSGFGSAIMAILDGDQPKLSWQTDGYYLGTVIARKGYPEIDDVGVSLPVIMADDVAVSYAGVEEDAGVMVSHGGRVMMVTAKAPTVLAAQRRVNRTIEANVDKNNFIWRTDIGHALMR